MNLPSEVIVLLSVRFFVEAHPFQKFDGGHVFLLSTLASNTMQAYFVKSVIQHQFLILSCISPLPW
jgi:hypothetical protein